MNVHCYESYPSVHEGAAAERVRAMCKVLALPIVCLSLILVVGSSMIFFLTACLCDSVTASQRTICVEYKMAV